MPIKLQHDYTLTKRNAPFGRKARELKEIEALCLLQIVNEECLRNRLLHIPHSPRFSSVYTVPLQHQSKEKKECLST